MLKYTLCLIRNGNQFLLLNRLKKPQMGTWNGVGGKIENGETPFESVIRETFEETGILLKELTYAGNVIFKSNEGREGMYLFTADLPEGSRLVTPAGTAEGILDWKQVDWILHKDNRGVASNLRAYLPAVLEGRLGLEHLFTYDQGVILDYTTAEVAADEINEKYIPPIAVS
ncbi:NUDIX hydrolase [Planomicrobium okeanokoites]|uniref:NUDIX domain-containing protein n=1 Tax=Planomicrobium okeanokoites TaxID=244 RepID=A0ABV7KJF4_PLAOK|nr:8-oxo-dGTP diphosphatase [Planomicrobium okeanokoites]TAA69084.1 8-oxo-dGTP diphosphatase [Planomicrobium okeanokoites]